MNYASKIREEIYNTRSIEDDSVFFSQQLCEEALIAGWLVLDAAHRDKSRHFSDREESPFL